MHRSHLLIAGLLVVVAGACASDDEPGAIETESVPDASASTTVASSTTVTASATSSDAATTATAPATEPPPSSAGEPEGTDPTLATTPSTGLEVTIVNEPPTPSPEALYERGDIDPGLQPFIDQAIDDLARRLDVDAATITTHAAVLVTWPDASLGCPQPDMRYPPNPIDGSVIELEHDGSYYRYHTGGMQAPFTCEPPLTKEQAPDPIDLLGGGDT